MPLTVDERVKIRVLLAEARTAYHQLQLGQSARVVVDGLSSERVEFTAANAPRLYSYILSLEAQLGEGPSVPYSGPAGFIF